MPDGSPYSAALTSIVVCVCRLQAMSQRLHVVYKRFIVIVATLLALSNQNRRYKTSALESCFRLTKYTYVEGRAVIKFRNLWPNPFLP